MSDFTHLHVHSHYSLLDGLGKINPLLVRAKELGMDSLALTDHGVMYGAIEFYQAAQEVGMKPIIGLEAYLAPNGHDKKRGRMDASSRHTTLLAKNNQGYQNLIQLTTKAHLEGYYYKPRIDYELLEKYGDGLIVLSGCLNGDIPKAIVDNRLDDAERIIKWHIERFGPERFYLEVQDHPSIKEQKIANDQILKYAKKFKLDVVATCDLHYIRPEDAEAQDVLVCVQTGKTVQDTDRMCMLDEDYSMKSPEEMKEAWKEHPEVIDNTQKIAEMCDVSIEFGVNRLPPFPLPKGVTADQALRKECLIGLKNRYGKNLPENAHERLDYELDVIKKTGYASYFLIVADFVNEAKKMDILVGPGRGSAAGSIVSYLLNITSIDPLAYNLLFERFLNPERVSMPDIDLDFADDRRDEIIEYVRKKYGNEHVAQIITFGTMAARAAIRDAGRSLGFPYSFCDQVAKSIPQFMNFEEALKNSPELKDMYDTDPQAKKLIDTAKKLEGVCRHSSTHAAGVVITDEPLTTYAPLQLSNTGEGGHNTVTQYTMKAIENLGLLKMDFLGLKNLSIISNALKRIKKRHGVDVDIDDLPINDEKSYRLLQEGKTTGVFQLESSGMKRYLKELRPTEFEDIISILALYRPGPMDSIPDFIASKHGRKKITYLHPILKPILEKTYGIIVTQDQVLQIAREFSGFSYAEADILRKAVGKKIKTLLDEQREKFIDGAITNKGIDKNTARKVWDFIEPFARYGFNRAHAACYAMIAYQTAYLKANYPADFMAALLTSDEGNMDRAAIEIAETLALGLKVLPPDVNESDESFTVIELEDNQEAIRFGLSGIKNVGHNIVSTLINERKNNTKYEDLSDLLARIDCKDFNRKSLESMVKAGAFDCLGERQQLLDHIEEILNFNKSLHKQQDKGQQGLFAATQDIAKPRLILKPTTAANKDERLRWEKELLGIYVSAHPLSDLHEEIQKVATPLSDLSTIQSNQTVRVAGVIARIKKIITKAGQSMAFVVIEDIGGSAEVLVFPSVLEKTKELWEDGHSVIVEGKLSDKDGETKILADKVWVLNKEILKDFSKPSKLRRKKKTERVDLVSITLSTKTTKESLKQLKEYLETNNCDEGAEISLFTIRNGVRAQIKTNFKIKVSQQVLADIGEIVGTEAVNYTST